MTNSRIAIAGAGIAGLTAAISLSRAGFSVNVFEKAEEFGEIGAGLQLSPNATRILDKLGLLDALSKEWHEPDRIGLVSGVSLREIAAVPAGEFSKRHWGAPYGVLQRTALHRVLVDAARAEPNCSITLASPLSGGGQLKIDGENADLTIAADGVWSGYRKRIAGHAKAAYSGYVAWRMMIDTAELPPGIGANTLTAFLGPSTHLVSYPLPASGQVNLVAVTRGRSPGEDWMAQASEARIQAELRPAFSSWHHNIRAMLGRVASCTYWPLFEVGDGPWLGGGDSPVVLIGDAAHAMMPFAAQGAAMAIEDAFELASTLSDHGVSQPALGAYVARRRGRIAKVRSRAAFNRFAYHARGPFRIGRNAVLKLRSPESLARDLDWLYGYRADGL